MSTTVSVSVALVTRNRPRSLGRALESWRAQRVAPDEIVVSDDSDAVHADETARIAAAFGCVYTSGPGRGLYANRNHAALACTGTHILSADDDHTHPPDYVAVARDLIAADRLRVWVFSERDPQDPAALLTCPPELHRSGFGCAPADSSRSAGIADGSTVYPRAIFDAGLRYDEQYAFGGLWYLWGKLLASRGWRISFSNRTFVWHHFRPDDLIASDGRLDDRGRLRDQLVVTTYTQFVDALWIERSVIRLAWALAYTARRLLVPDSIVGFHVRTRLPARGAAAAAWRACLAGPRYLA